MGLVNAKIIGLDESKINVNGHTEKKGRFTYLSWTFAVSEAMKVDPLTVWAFREPMVFPDGTMMVHCDVTMFGKSIYMFLPVMNQNKAIPKPNAFDVNMSVHFPPSFPIYIVEFMH